MNPATYACARACAEVGVPATHADRRPWSTRLLRWAGELKMVEWQGVRETMDRIAAAYGIESSGITGTRSDRAIEIAVRIAMSERMTVPEEFERAR